MKTCRQVQRSLITTATENIFTSIDLTSLQVRILIIFTPCPIDMKVHFHFKTQFFFSLLCLILINSLFALLFDASCFPHLISSESALIEFSSFRFDSTMLLMLRQNNGTVQWNETRWSQIWSIIPSPIIRFCSKINDNKIWLSQRSEKHPIWLSQPRKTQTEFDYQNLPQIIHFWFTFVYHDASGMLCLVTWDWEFGENKQLW